MSYRPNPLKQTFHTARRLAAGAWLALMPAVQIGITGSQGKTNTSSTLYHLLSHLAPTERTDLNLDTIYNIPMTALKVRPQTKYVIFEMGVDHLGEMDTHLEIARPKIAIITGISPVHTDAQHLGSFANLIKEKRKLIEALPTDGYAVLNGDDENVRAMASHTKARVIFYGKNDNNDIVAQNISLSLEGTAFSFTVNTFAIGGANGGIPKARRLAGITGGRALAGGNEQQNLLQINTPLIGLHHIYNIMAAYIIYRLLGFTDDAQLQSLMATLKPLSGRMSLEKGPLGTTILDDSLRANPASTASGLRTFDLLKTAGKKIAVLAEMGELEKPEEEHAKIGKLLASLKIDYVAAIGDLHKATIKAALNNGFPQHTISLSPHVLDAAEKLRKIIGKGDVIYLKGSLLRHIERVPMVLAGEQVGCQAVSCPFYHHCPRCKYVVSGYQE